MPYKIQRGKKGGWDIVKKATGEVVGHSDTIAKARASIGYRESGAGEQKKKP